MRNTHFKKLYFRVRLLVRHPLLAINYIFSGEQDYSKITMSEIRKYLTDPELIVEAGAADGVDTELFAINFPSAIVLAIEPVEEQFDFLVDKFRDFANVKVKNLALSKESGSARINIGKSVGRLGGMGSSSLLRPKDHTQYFPEIEFANIQEVETLKLSDLLSDFDDSLVDLLWLDIQGAELEVLIASREIFISKVKLLHIEISRVNLYENMPTEREIRRFLKQSGFKCVIDRVGAISGNALYLNTREDL